jgi:hypothetical protein
VSYKKQELLTFRKHPSSPPGGVRVAHLFSFCVVLLYVFEFLDPCCDVYYDFLIKMMFCSSLLPVVCRRAHVLFTLFMFVCIQWCLTHIVLCFLFCLSSSCVLCPQCFQFLWNVHSWLPLRFSLTFICFVCLRSVSCVPNVASFSGMFILDCPFGFL